MTDAPAVEQVPQGPPRRPRWMIVVGAIALVALGAVGGATFASHNTDNPAPAAARISRQAQFLLAAAARVRAEQAQAQGRTRIMDGQQLTAQVREHADQDLVRATQQRLDAYAPVVFRLRGISIDERNLAISEPADPPRLSQVTLQPIVRSQIAKDAAFDAVAATTADVSTPAVVDRITRLSNAVSGAEATFVLLSQHADSYTTARYNAVVLNWVSSGDAVETALAAYQNQATGVTSR